MTFVHFITMWLTRDPDNGVPPLSKIGTYHWKGHALQHRRVCGDMQYLMRHVKRKVVQLNKWRSAAHQWCAEETLILYNYIVSRFQFKSRSRKSRFNEFSWRTIVNLVRNHKGVLVGEEENEAIEERV